MLGFLRRELAVHRRRVRVLYTHVSHTNHATTPGVHTHTHIHARQTNDNLQQPRQIDKTRSASSRQNSCLSCSPWRRRRCRRRREPLGRGQHPCRCKKCSRETRQKQEPVSTTTRNPPPHETQKPKTRGKYAHTQTHTHERKRHGRVKFILVDRSATPTRVEWKSNAYEYDSEANTLRHSWSSSLPQN